MSESSIVKNILDYIEENLQEDLSLDNVAGEFNYSKFYINRLFTKEVGCTIYKYIQTRRLTEAARQLVETELPIVEIAQEAHYNSQQAFTLAFHQVYLQSPQVYRKNGIYLPKQSKVVMRLCIMGGKIAA